MNVQNKFLNADITKCLMLVEFLSLLGKCNNPCIVDHGNTVPKFLWFF